MHIDMVLENTISIHRTHYSKAEHPKICMCAGNSDTEYANVTNIYTETCSSQQIIIIVMA